MDSLTNDEVQFMGDSLTKLKSSRGVHFNQTIFEMHRKLQFFFDFSACPLNVRQELAHLLGNCLDERADQFNDREEILDLLKRNSSHSTMVRGIWNGYQELLQGFKSMNFQCENAFYDLRILFVLTCLSTNSNVEPLSTTVVDLATEAFKVLFTVISSGMTMQAVSAIDTSIFFNNLVLLCRRYLLSACECAPKHQNLISQVINVLTLCIPETYPLLIPVCSLDSTGNDKIYRGYDVSALNVILQLLSKQCDDSDTSVMQPTLALLICIARSNRIYRKYLRHEILPPLKDVHTRPENDVTIRGKLVRFMTSVTHVSMWVADFLYVLCKENVDRLVKYTGFGNAAGLLASLGMLTTAQLKNSKTDESNCSSSTDSETEEYKQAKDLINPVLGCVEPPKPNPMEGMTEEEKEHEAVQLVNQIDSLMKQGLVMPARVCEDGKVHPIEHVLQLQEGLPETANSSSDTE
ncbi:Synembryn-A [Trichinella spiralis]|uniref:Synembryn-A n=1 Tax=Trichinella spiralis TaxID=6334 RepID=A0ABR3K5E1_TRISP